MYNKRPEFSNYGIVKTFVLPGLLIFLVPVISLLFFRNAEKRFDSDMRETVKHRILANDDLSAEERKAALEFFAEHPFSELVADVESADQIDRTTRFYYATLRWMYWLSVFSITSGIAVLVLATVCVVLSRRSQRGLFLSLSVGWHALRIYGTAQVIMQGAMLTALSFWVTALSTHTYHLQLIVLVGIFALAGAAAVIRAIFQRANIVHAVEGRILDRAAAPRLCSELAAICQRIGAAQPDQIVVGIDDNFFVSESPLNVGGTACQGRTLFVSLPLLKQMNGAEANAVMAHEMAHFSGNDTYYSKKIGPLLIRWEVYLQALDKNLISRPIFYFMLCFRVLFEFSLGRHRRAREFRADRIAVEITSPPDLAGALVRIAAFSDFRNIIQTIIFNQERVLEGANISDLIEKGFRVHAVSVAAKLDLGSIETAHPFDTHPPLAQRLDAIGLPLVSQDVQTLVSTPGDGLWYNHIDQANELEQQQWQLFEERFRGCHEGTLAFRLLPETDEERAIVARSFPERTIEGRKGSLILDCETMRFTAWPGSLAYAEITGCTYVDGMLCITYDRDEEPATAIIPMKQFAKREAEALQAIQNYRGRYEYALAYQDLKHEQAPAGDHAPVPSEEA